MSSPSVSNLPEMRGCLKRRRLLRSISVFPLTYKSTGASVKTGADSKERNGLKTKFAVINSLAAVWCQKSLHSSFFPLSLSPSLALLLIHAQTCLGRGRRETPACTRRGSALGLTRVHTALWIWVSFKCLGYVLLFPERMGQGRGEPRLIRTKQ